MPLSIKTVHTVKRWPSQAGILPELPGAKARPRQAQDERKAVIGGLLSRLLFALSYWKKEDAGDSS